MFLGDGERSTPLSLGKRQLAHLLLAKELERPARAGEDDLALFENAVDVKGKATPGRVR